MTLLEVLAALAILSTLLAGLLVASGRAKRQEALAERKLAAVAAADQLMQEWWETGTLPAKAADGDFPTDPRLRWRVSVLRASKRRDPFDVVALEVIGSADELVLVRVEWWRRRSKRKRRVFRRRDLFDVLRKSENA